MESREFYGNCEVCGRHSAVVCERDGGLLLAHEHGHEFGHAFQGQYDERLVEIRVGRLLTTNKRK